MSCFSCQESVSYYPFEKKDLAVQIRDAAWQDTKIATVYKVGGYFMNAGILCVFVGMSTAIIGPWISFVAGAPSWITSAISNYGLAGSLAIFPLGIICFGCMAFSERKVKQLICSQLGATIDENSPSWFRVDVTFIRETAPSTISPRLIKAFEFCCVRK